MEIKIVDKKEIDLQQMAKLTYNVMKRDGSLTENTTEKFIFEYITESVTRYCHDPIFIAESNAKIVGWLAFYSLTEGQIAQIYNWHPMIFSIKNENEIAIKLIQKAFLYLKQVGKDKVTIDFVPINDKTQCNYNKRLDWYSQKGVTKSQEESYYKKNISKDNYEVNFPENYSVKLIISETKLDEVFDCWLKIFTASKDNFFYSLEPKERKNFFYTSWNKKEPLINEASFALFHKEKLIGLSRLLPKYEETDGYLAPIGIIPDYRRKGLAEELLKLSIQKLKLLNYQTMSFYVSSNNHSAISFYEKLGFQAQNKIASLIGKI
ncbi:MAG: GNAT family N-acetyltransferase [Candidatus Heimdallarchaeota archaeon]